MSTNYGKHIAGSKKLVLSLSRFVTFDTFLNDYFLCQLPLHLIIFSLPILPTSNVSKSFFFRMSYENNASQVLEITWSTPWYLQNFNTKISDASQRKELLDFIHKRLMFLKLLKVLWAHNPLPSR